MIFEAVEIKDKTGQTIVLRSAEEADAEDLIRYLKKTSAETPYLIREPDEVTLTLEQEQGFIRQMKDSAYDLMIIATDGDRHIGNCSISSVASYKRYAHRCSVAIALYKEYWGRGIGKCMMQTVLAEAKRAGYEQAELEVVAGNDAAIALYKKLGFQTHGQLPNNMKYSDGTYTDALWMAKKL